MRAAGMFAAMVMSNSTSMCALAINFHEGSVPEWVQLTPTGPELEGRDGRKWKLTNPQTVVDAFVSNGADLPLDYEHSTQIKGGEGEPAPAVGWIKELSVRMAQIWARVEWTSEGEWAVSEKQYRYLSPAFAFDKKTGEVIAMVSAGLTNQPNFEMAALNRRQNREESETMDKAVLEALGLAQNATAADVVVAINKLKEAETTALNSAQIPDATKFVPKADHDLALNKITDFEKADTERADAAITTAVDAAVEAGKIAPASKDFHVAACKANGVEAFNTMIEGMPVIAGKSDLDTKDPTKKGTKLTPEEIAVCKQMGMSQEDFAKGKSEQEN